MARVKIKSEDTTQSNRIILLRILSANIIYATRIITVQDCFIVLTRSDEEVDKIFQQKTQQELTNNRFLPILPPELKAKRTVLIFNTDEYIYNHTEKEIEEELLTKNTWMNEGIDSIFKIPRTKILKVTFKETTAAKKTTEKGIPVFHMSIPAHTVKIEEYIPITTCLKCYAIEDHITSECPKPKEYKICSECSSNDHTWRECSASNIRKCINCKGEHRTLANKCPQRKKALEEKRQQLKNNNSTKTYSNVTSANKSMAPLNLPASTPTIEKETAAKLMACLMHAHLINSTNPGTYNDEFNRALKLNNLPPIILPNNPPSKQIVNLTKEVQTPASEENTQNTENAHPQGTHNPSQPTHQEQDTNEDALDMPPLEKMKGRAIGLQIITKKSEGWPKDTTLTLKSIRQGIDIGLYKFRYTNPVYTEQEILLYLINNDIDLSNCWCTIDDTQFNKIRNGLHQDLTPPPNKATKHRHRHRHASK